MRYKRQILCSPVREVPGRWQTALGTTQISTAIGRHPGAKTHGLIINPGDPPILSIHKPLAQDLKMHRRATEGGEPQIPITRHNLPQPETQVPLYGLVGIRSIVLQRPKYR